MKEPRLSTAVINFLLTILICLFIILGSIKCHAQDSYLEQDDYYRPDCYGKVLVSEYPDYKPVEFKYEVTLDEAVWTIAWEIPHGLQRKGWIWLKPPGWDEAIVFDKWDRIPNEAYYFMLRYFPNEFTKLNLEFLIPAGAFKGQKRKYEPVCSQRKKLLNLAG